MMSNSEPIAAGYGDWEWEGLRLYGSLKFSYRFPRVLLASIYTDRYDGEVTVDMPTRKGLCAEDFAALSRIVLAKLHELRRGSLPPATDYESALAYALDREHAIALRELMSEISECATAARWVSGLECDLWAELQKGEGEYGIEPARMERLRSLSEKSGGWWYWPRHSEETGARFIPLTEWRVKYQEYEAQEGGTP